jgi:hypothetical protein
MAAPAEWSCRRGRNGIFTVSFFLGPMRAWQFFNTAKQPVAGRSHKAIAAWEER